ncbi:MAG: YggT family protein [Candidatus Omnitrophota bacterium]|jgi:YggT family protein
MFVLGNFIYAVAQILNMALSFLMFLIFVRALISWVNPDPFNPIVRFLVQTTEPILMPIRRLLPGSMMIDLSPMIALLLAIFLQSFAVQTLVDIAVRMKM